MLKYVVSLLCALFVFGGVFANEDVESLLAPEPDYTKTETVQGKITSDYLKKGGGKVAIEYMPAYDEARFKYSCPTPLFEQSTAMLAIKESIEAFVRERGYYFYTYLKPDDTYYDGTSNTVIYTSYIKLLK